MAFSLEGKRSLSMAMRRQADMMTCPVCERRAALVMRRIGERHRTWCRWIDLGKCQSTPENDTR